MREPVVVTFVATLADKGACFNIYNDGCGRIVLQTDESQFKQLASLGYYGRNTQLRVRVEIDRPSGT